MYKICSLHVYKVELNPSKDLTAEKAANWHTSCTLLFILINLSSD